MKCVVMPGLDGTGALHHAFQTALSAAGEVSVLSYPPTLGTYDALDPWVRSQLPDDPFVMVAESFSGPLAIRLAADPPQGLAGVVFAASFAHRPRRLPAALAWVIRGVPIRWPILQWMMQPLVMGRWSTASFRRDFAKALVDVRPRIMAQRLHQVMQVDARPDLARITCPILYLQARHDRLVPVRAARPFGDVGARVITLDGPHFLLQAQPERTAQAIAKFMQTLPA